VFPEPQSRVPEAAFRTPHQPVHRRARHDPVLDLGVTSFRFSGCMAQWGSRSPPLSGKALKPSWLMCWRLSRRSGPTLAHHSKRPFPFCTSTFRIGCLGPEGPSNAKLCHCAGQVRVASCIYSATGCPGRPHKGSACATLLAWALVLPQNFEARLEIHGSRELLQNRPHHPQASLSRPLSGVRAFSSRVKANQEAASLISKPMQHICRQAPRQMKFVTAAD
jgi:hypothetical protein